MVDLSMASLLPILISCVTATCFTYILMGSKSLFDFTLTNPWALDRVPACLLLGIFCGLVSFISCAPCRHARASLPSFRLIHT